jgi:4'-phosphopantetheinyl transferase
MRLVSHVQQDEPMTGWRTPPRSPALCENEVHVWGVRGPFQDAALADSLDLLSPDERARANGYLRTADKHLFVVARVLARTALAQYLHRDPRSIAFDHGRHGKPSVAASSHHRLGFNISHSGDIVVCAVAPVEAIGVDIERVRSTVSVDALAARHFSPAEREALGRWVPEARRAAFFTVWTRKEAYLKALGTGFSIAPESFTVAAAPDEPARLVAPAPDSKSRAWSVADFEPAAGYAGAVVVEGSGWHYRFWNGSAVAGLVHP